MAYYGTKDYGINHYSAAEVDVVGSVVSFSVLLAGIATAIRQVAGAVSVAPTLGGVGAVIRQVAGSVDFAAILTGDPVRVRGAAGNVSLEVLLAGNAVIIASVSGDMEAVFNVAHNDNSTWANGNIEGDWSPVVVPSGPWVDNTDPAGIWANG